MSDYFIQQVLSRDLVRIARKDRHGTDTTLWARRKLRKPSRCAVNGWELAKGSEAFGPAKGTEGYRYERIDAQIVDHWIAVDKGS